MGLHCHGWVNPFAGIAPFIPWGFWKVPTAPLGSAGAEGSGGQGCAPIPHRRCRAPLGFAPRGALRLRSTNILAQARSSPLVSGMLPAS